MSISPTSFRVYLAGTTTPVDFFTDADEGVSFDFVLTYAEPINSPTGTFNIGGNFGSYLTTTNGSPTDANHSLLLRATLKTGLSVDVGQLELSIPGGIYDSSGVPVSSELVTLTDQSGDPFEIRTGTVPEIITGSGDTHSVLFPENLSGYINVDTMDDGTIDPSSVTYTLSGADADLFTITSPNGRLSFKNVPDFENRQDSDSNNVYEVTVTVTDVIGQTDSQDISITIDDRNDPATGWVSVAGTAREDETLYTLENIVDQDGIGVYRYQ